MAGTIIVSSIKTDTDNSFIVRSNTGATLFSVDTSTISIPDGSITSAMIANGTVIAADILDGTITTAKIADGNVTNAKIDSVANTKITGLITSGQIASVANTQITGNITQSQIATGVAGTGPAFSAYQGTLQSISNNTNTKLTINTEDFDTNSNYDNATNYRFTPTVAGYYQINGAVYFASPSQDANVKIFKNGVNWKIGVQGGTGAYIYGSTVSDIIYFNGSTDYVELYGYQNSGTSKNTEASRTTTYFSAAMIRSA